MLRPRLQRLPHEIRVLPPHDLGHLAIVGVPRRRRLGGQRVPEDPPHHREGPGAEAGVGPVLHQVHQRYRVPKCDEPQNHRLAGRGRHGDGKGNQGSHESNLRVGQV